MGERNIKPLPLFYYAVGWDNLYSKRQGKRVQNGETVKFIRGMVVTIQPSASRLGLASALKY